MSNMLTLSGEEIAAIRKKEYNLGFSDGHSKGLADATEAAKDWRIAWEKPLREEIARLKGEQ